MKNLKRMFFVSILVALASQVNIGLVSSDFRVSAGIILYVIFLFYYEDLKPVPTGILSGIIVNLLRSILYYFTMGNFNHVILSFQIEILFYTFYAIIYYLLTNEDNKKNINYIFLVMVISDFGANIIEIFIRTIIGASPFPWQITSTLFLVALVRSGITWLVLNLFKYYKMLLIKEEHEERYKRLLWLTSQLKTEMYWMEKNMDNIEKVMSDSYKLFEMINTGEDENSWGERSINIARDIHEIKKENGLAIRGIKEITESELKDEKMSFKDIINILFETMKREIRRLNKNIELEIDIEENFYTSQHYYLMSIFRNLIMNSIDAIPDTQKNGKISIAYRIADGEHVFMVSDNGSGIDEEGLKHIFSPGYSTKINYDTGEINRGLGLSIVKHIVEEQLEGRLKVSSQLGKGTTIYIYIPKHSLEVR
ncbi:MAG: Two-component system, sensor histidine kinase YcbA [Sporanaerobacter sp.]|uniref:sensor histidine kinase n=1 Tax=Sporanaerobacter sp. TaxID=2010183 RepID=UPI003A0FBFED